MTTATHASVRIRAAAYRKIIKTAKSRRGLGVVDVIDAMVELWESVEPEDRDSILNSPHKETRQAVAAG